MEQENKKIKAFDVLIIGLAFFANYFGAGNLIFPPMLGLQSGTQWVPGMIAMIISGVGLPILAIIVIGMRGSVQRITDHVHKRLYTLFIGLTMICCICVSIPRTAAVGIEMGLQGLWGGAPYIPAVIVYFIIAYFFAKDRGTALDKIGKILTPAMTVILFILVIKGAADPIGAPAEPSVDNSFINSFLGAYNTGDVIVSFLMATTFLGAITNKGYTGEQIKKVNLRAGTIAAICLAVIYGGLLYMGACVSGEYTPDSIGNAELLLTVIRSSGGQIAIYGLCMSVVLACLTTAIGQITAVADFFETETHGKLPYKVLVPVVCVAVILVASLGLDKIVAITSPTFSFSYAIALVLLLLGVFERFIPNDGGYKGAVYFTVVYASLDLLTQYGVHIGIVDGILNAIPLYNMGFGWIVPALMGFIIGVIVYPRIGKKSEKVDLLNKNEEI
ncbi:MAG: branched-chain amino acid transport system II carrier protein [Candidatus Metalachnospira sp.]|nr:branched-chain amino acid transport system II carrier protein [Candidatus Metalachnospira sp.]